MLRPVMRALAAFFVVLAALVVTRPARAAFTPPPLNGHVIDTAGVLSEAEVRRLDTKLELARKQTGFAIVVYTLASLPSGANIEDVAYDTFNTWKVGSAKGDDGVLLVNAVAEHKLRIETGKGVGGGLTDIGSSHINRDVIGPLLRQNRFYDAYDKGTTAILDELTQGTPGGKSDPGMGPANRGRDAAQSPLRTGLAIGVVVLVILLAIISPTFREILFWMLLFGFRGGGGGGGGGGGSGYGGGGGRSGGGGSSDDY